jgi:mercuric ion transport protein
MNDGLKSSGAVALVAAGIASAFTLATCCALPILFGSAALIFAPIAVASEPHTQLLTGASVIALVGSVGLAARARKLCEPNSICGRPWFKWSIIVAAMLGGALLLLAKSYA